MRIEETSLIGLLRLIIIFVLVLYLVRILSRVVLPFVLRYLVHKTTEKINRQNNFSPEKPFYKKKAKKQKKEEFGEYVDFKELD